MEIYKITYFEFEKEQFNFKLKIVFPKQFFVKCFKKYNGFSEVSTYSYLKYSGIITQKIKKNTLI